MAYNERLKAKFAVFKKRAQYRMAKVQQSMHDMAEKMQHHDDHSIMDRHDNKDLASAHGGNAGLSFRNRRRKEARTRTAVRFRAGILDILMGNKDTVDKVRVHVISGILGNVKETFDQFDTNKNGNIDKSALAPMLAKLLDGSEPGEEEITRILREMKSASGTGEENEVSYAEFEKWYMDCEMRVDAERERVFAAIDTKGVGYLEQTEFRDILKKLHVNERDLTDDEIAHGWELFGGKQGKITRENFDEWYQSNLLHTHLLSEEQRTAHDQEVKKHEDLEDHEEPEEGVSMAMPDDLQGRIIYFILLPLNGLLILLCQTCGGETVGKNCVVSFFMSIVWIGLYSYIMVWSATIIGDLVGIPQPVMGLTVLAAGTSVPDLISSVIVPSKGTVTWLFQAPSAVISLT